MKKIKKHNAASFLGLEESKLELTQSWSERLGSLALMVDVPINLTCVYSDILNLKALQQIENLFHIGMTKAPVQTIELNLGEKCFVYHAPANKWASLERLHQRLPT